MEPVVLCATDFSANAHQAMDWAAYMAQRLRAKLYLYHCYQIPVIMNEVLLPAEIETENTVKEGLFKLMDEEKQRTQRKYPHLKIETEVEAGMASDSVIEYANRVNAHLIVTGITGRNAAGQVLIGSTAVSIANNGKIPVLIVPHDVPLKSFNNIAFASDETTSDHINGMDVLLDIVRSFDSNLEIVKVCETKQELNESVSHLRQLKEFDEVKHSYNAVQDENVENGLIKFIERNHIDLLTVVHHYRGFLKRLFTRSHTGKLAYQVKVPLLVLHQK